MIKITVKQLKSMKACEAGIKWFTSQKKRSLKLVIAALLKEGHFDYARWLLRNLLTCKQNALWAIASAESVLGIFEARRPNDLRPRQAIQAAKDYLNKKISWEQLVEARRTANAYAAAYAADAAYAAAYAANAADAVNAAAYAANATAVNAAYAASTAYDAYEVIQQKKEVEVCNFALRLLGEIK